MIQCDCLPSIHRSGRTVGVVVSSIVFLFTLGIPAIGPPLLADDAPSASVPTVAGSSRSAFETLESAEAGSQASHHGTRVSVPVDLEPLLERGGTPASLDHLRSMERQQQQVAAKASRCTVSVKIGPAQGCGVIITGSGYIVTAAHVAMRPGKAAVVTLSDGHQVTATTLGMNRHVDAGLMRINPGQNAGKPWPHASLGTSDELVPGMWCIAMGHPGGYDSARGTVIRVGRLLEVRPDVLVSDCALIGGDSGGPLFDMAGELIAVHSRIGNDVTENLHVPIDHYDYSWERMASGEAWGFLPNFKPTLGVTGNQSDSVARIIAVKNGSPAENGGLLAEDVVEQFGEKVILNFQSLKDAVADTMPGERVPIWVRRGSGRIRLVVEIGRSG
ncbi:S1C family serine protease [Stieleria sp. TO1_6]|uniref:S1C family serine protease n=1 Tax=Stieleria tagensis TaxID=2956795 RepID=UPI00209AEA76|nr:trypsin-like peptidase domain-containing protein [Stieleria tagensis]MCO8124992.1 S1C family serine protease [Stieleria tagensis]